MPCLLHILGESFDPSTAPELAALKPLASYRRGDPNPGGGSGFTEVGGLTCEVSPRARMIDLVEQSTAYLVRHQALLAKLDALDAVRYRTLAFQVGLKEFEALEFRFTLPPTLLKLCAGLKLGVSLIVQAV